MAVRAWRADIRARDQHVPAVRHVITHVTGTVELRSVKLRRNKDTVSRSRCVESNIVFRVLIHVPVDNHL